MPRLVIPPPFRGPTRGEATIEVAGATVRACLDAAEAHFPGFRAQVLTPAGGVHGFVRLFLNGASLPAACLDQSLEQKDEVTFLAAIAGG